MGAHQNAMGPLVPVMCQMARQQLPSALSKMQQLVISIVLSHASSEDAQVAQHASTLGLWAYACTMTPGEIPVLSPFLGQQLCSGFSVICIYVIRPRLWRRTIFIPQPRMCTDWCCFAIRRRLAPSWRRYGLKKDK